MHDARPFRLPHHPAVPRATATPIGPKEDTEEETEHIERGQSSRDQANTPQDVVPHIAASRCLASIEPRISSLLQKPAKGRCR